LKDANRLANPKVGCAALETRECQSAARRVIIL
jgi:hypothetical protein